MPQTVNYSISDDDRLIPPSVIVEVSSQLICCPSKLLGSAKSCRDYYCAYKLHGRFRSQSGSFQISPGRTGKTCSRWSRQHYPCLITSTPSENGYRCSATLQLATYCGCGHTGLSGPSNSRRCCLDGTGKLIIGLYGPNLSRRCCVDCTGI